MISVSAETASANRFLIEGPGPKAWIHNYVDHGRIRADGSPRQAGDAVPMIYLVDQEPNSTIQMHFHQVEQFQVVVGGSGKMGRHRLAPITVHYAAPFTGYGPLQSGPDGLQYITIRNRWDPGLRPLPEARAELPPAGSYRARQRIDEPHLQDHGRWVDWNAPAQIFAGDEGYGAWRVSVPAEASYSGGSDPDHDRVIVVCSGRLTSTQANEAMSCHFICAGDPLELEAGACGADLLILQFAHAARAALAS